MTDKKINVAVLNKIVESVKSLLDAYENDVNSAYIRMLDEDLPLSVAIKLSPDADGIKIDTKLSFPSGAKISDSVSNTVDPDQMDLEFEVKEE